MDKRIVVTGASGMLGRLCVDHFRAIEECQVVPLAHNGFDLLYDDTIEEAIRELRPNDVIIHTAAMTDVDRCEREPEVAHRVNGLSVGTVGRIAAEAGAQVIYISSDYVFDGTQRAPYTEADRPNPISSYGRSKLAGEEELFKTSLNHIAVRVSWLFGPTEKKKCFPEWAVNLALDGKDVPAVSDKVGSPTYAVDVVRYIEPFVRATEPYSGVFHLTNSGECTGEQWAQHTLDCAKAAGIPIKTERVIPVDLDALAQRLNWPAKRPLLSALSTEKFTQATGQTPRSWQQAVEHFVSVHLAPKMRGGGV